MASCLKGVLNLHKNDRQTNPCRGHYVRPQREISSHKKKEFLPLMENLFLVRAGGFRPYNAQIVSVISDHYP